MLMTTKSEYYVSAAPSGNMVVVIDRSVIEDFKEMIRRAHNVWPDAVPSAKEFADLVTEGKILQDYYGQDTSNKRIL
jgi:hypothetical protein